MSVLSRERSFELSELREALLADAIAADAQFQLQQALAWQRFGASITNPGEAPLPLSAGLDRLGQLGVTELAVTVPLERIRPAWWRRALRWFASALGSTPPALPEARFRVARRRKRAVIEYAVRVSRGEDGRFTCASDPAGRGG